MANPAPYSLLVRCFPPGHFVVQSVQGREALSEPYRIDVEVVSASGEELVERVALGQRAVLIMRVGAAPRAIHGIVARVTSVGPRETHGAHQVRFRIVPRLWLLRHRRGSRIFQNQRVSEVVDRVLHESNVPTRWALHEPAPLRRYCTQYEETDAAFVAGEYLPYARNTIIVHEQLKKHGFGPAAIKLLVNTSDLPMDFMLAGAMPAYEI